MKLDRRLIKKQAKQLIKNNVFSLFIISLIISILTGLSLGVSFSVEINNFARNGFPFSEFGGNYDYGDYDFGDYDFDDDFNNFDFEKDEFGKDFNNFGNEYNDDFDFEYNFNSFGQEQKTTPAVPNTGNVVYTSNPFSFFVNILEILLAPLAISLAGYYVSFIRGRKVEIGDGLNTVFNNTFKNNYGKKVALAFLRSLFCGLLCLLFIVPGIIYYYSTYFAYQIMADNPEISPMDALKLSKQMVKGNRSELFVLDLSFILWDLLCVFILPIIYVIPYVSTTKALFYENFRIRALQEGRVTEDDFLSTEQKYAKYADINANPNGYQPYSQPNNQQYYNQQNANPYYNTQPNNPYYQQQQNYAPNQNAYYNPPQQQANYYAQPQQPPADYYSPAPNKVKAEEEPRTEDYSPTDEPIKTEGEPQAPVKDPWEINHED